MTSAVLSNAIIGIAFFLLIDLLCFMWLQSDRRRSYVRLARPRDRQRGQHQPGHQWRNRNLARY